MEKSEIEKRFRDIVVEQLGINPEQFKPEASFIEDFGADSLDTVELVMAIEEYFDIDVTDEDCERMTTVQKALDYLDCKLNPGGN